MSMFKPQPIARARDAVESQIRRAIITKSLAEGERLPSEAELSRLFHVSRSTVRDALRSLATIGLIKKVPGASGGTFVRKMGADTLGDLLSESLVLLVQLGNATHEEVLSVRAMLEVPACRLAAVNRTEEDLAEMRTMLEQQKATPVDAPEVPDLDISFHRAVTAAAHNPVLSAFIVALHSGSRPGEHIRLSVSDGKATVRQHLELYRAIERSEPDVAESVIRRHLEYLGHLPDYGRAKVE